MLAKKKGAGKNKKRVIVMGKGSLAIKISDWFLRSKDFMLIKVVPVIPEPSWTKSLLNWAKSKNVPVVESGDYKEINLKKDRPDLVVSVFYEKILDGDFIDNCKKIINIHNAPLPKYRGVAPINWALKNKETEHGVTIHQIDKGVDTGPIIAQLKYSIYPEFDEVIDVYERALEYAWVLFKQTMPILDKIIPRKQDDKAATYYSNKDKKKLKERRDFTKAVSLGKEKKKIIKKL